MLLVLLWVGWATGCPVSAQTVVDVVPDPSTNLVGSDNGTAVQPLESFTIADGISFTFSIGSGSTQPAYYRSDISIRLYKGNTFKIESPADCIIEQIEFLTVRGDESTFSAESGSLSYNAETKVYTWVNSGNYTEENFVINNGQLRITNVSLWLNSSSEVVNLPKAPVFSQKSCDFYADFELAITDLNEPAALIKYTIDGSDPSAENGLTYSAPITIPAGNSITVKAVAINENGTSPVVSAIYNYVAKHLLNIKLLNKNGIGYGYYSSNSEYGGWYGDCSVYILEGETVNIEYQLNTGYKNKSVTLNGVAQDISDNYFDFVMPSSTVEFVIDTEFDPSSPSDPQPSQPADTTKRYTLTLVSNPLGAGSQSGSGTYVAGNTVSVSTSAHSGYVFTGWTKDGESVNTNSSFRYTMPASDVVLTANYVYNPSSPSDPQQPQLKRPLTAIASPAGAGSFSTTGSEVLDGNEYYVYAYPSTGYKFKGWIVNGVAREETSTQLRGIMTEEGASVVGLFVFDPSSPSNPGANYYNAETGVAIIDDFTPGSLYSALRDVIGSNNYENVSNLIVKGRLESGDYGSLSYLGNAATIDLSRTGGTTTVPGYAFQYLSASNILLSSEVTSIGNYVFYDCANLTSLTVYAQVPPTCSAYTFSNFTNKENCTVYVPASAIELYTNADYWKDFTILPISTDAHVLQVNLPEEALDGRYKHNSLEIVNINSGVRQKYVISDRLLYTFNGLRKDEQYSIYMYSQSGLEIGRIENIVIPDQDIEVTFNNLKTLHTVYAKVLAPDGSDLTSQVTIEWLKSLEDGTITYLRKANSLSEVPEGEQLLCRVSLDNKLGVVYVTPNDAEFTVTDGQKTCEITLVSFRTIALTGSVVDGDGTALSGASISVNQILNGKYSKTFTAKSDRKGQWSLSVLDAPESYFTYAATECVNVLDTIGAFDPNVETFDVGRTTLKSIVGARVTYGFTYHAAGVEEVETYYSDYQNVTISVFNVTQNRAHREVSLQYPILAVLDENINVGDELRLTATSKVGAFNPIEQTVTIGENQRAEVTFDIIGKGGISASFEMTENPAVIAMLYSAKGELLKKVTYSEATVLFTELEDGDYTLVTMGQSDLMNSILRLSNFEEIGLTEGKDYVKNSVTVESGKLTEVKNTEVPAFDESLFYYTNSSTSFSSNKSSITTGNYLTLRSAIDFKGVYRNDISNVVLVVDLPEACDFVEQSVIQGPNLLPYTFDNNRLTIQLGNDYKSQVRFCVVPTSGGSFNATASIVFDYNDKSLTQPIGSATSEIKDLEITVPSVIAGTTFKATGTALAKSDVRIYENGSLLGSGKANGAGSWNIECELVNPYNLSIHSIYAEITTPTGNTLTSETKTLTYDVDALQVSKVTMYHWNPELNGWKGKMEESVFDFLNPKTTATQWTVYYPKKVFTYTIEFTDNDPERISNVILYVHTADGKFVPCKAEFNEQKGLWYTEIDMGTSSDGYYPVNCSVDFDYQVSERKVDNRQFNDIIESDSRFMSDYTDIMDNLKELSKSDEILSEQQWSDFYSQNGLVIGDVESDIIFPSDFDNWSEEEKVKFCNSITESMDTEMKLIEEELNMYHTLFSMDSESNSAFFGDGSGIIVKSCEGITVESLTEQGFTSFKCLDETFIYTLITPELTVVVDFTNNLYIEASGSMLQTLGLGDDFISLLRKLRSIYNKWNASNIGLCINILKEIRGVFENANIKFSSLLTNAEVELLSKATNWINTLSHQQGRYRQLINSAPNSAIAHVYRQKLNDVMAKKALAQGFKSCIKPAFKLLARSLPIVDWIAITADLINKAIDIQRIYALIDKKDCLSDYQRQDFINQNRWLLGRVGAYASGSIIPTAIGDAEIFVGILGTMETGGVSLGVSVMGFIVKSVAQISTLILDNMLSADIKNLKNEIQAVKCPTDCGEPGMPDCPDPNPGNGGNNGGGKTGGGANQSGSTSDNVKIDPSGFVYEAVPTNRVEGVRATIYYKETKEDMYGDLYEEVILWDAEEYAQKNPLFTDEHGMYRWDVPQGLWQVKFEKDGYGTTHSEWLPVPPPQLEVNIGIVQNKQPEVTEARAYEEGVEVQFDKFMDLSTLTTDNIYVTANGEKLNGEILFIDSSLADEYASEEDIDATRYASRVRFEPETSLSVTTGEIRVTVSRNVLSYAGIPMTETFSQVLDVEKEVQFISALDCKVLYGEEKEVTVYALPYEAAVGRTLHVVNSSDLIASVDTKEVILDEEGKAVIKVKGELPGCTQLTFSIDDVTATGSCAVDVVTEIIKAEAPKASRASGTAVYRGTKVELTTESKDAVIYFTTDGSCPCDEDGTRRKYTVPIVINEDTKILAMTTVGTGDDDVSETMEFNYTLKRSDMEFQMEAGWTWVSHNFESAIAPSELALDEGVSRILSQTQEVIRDPQLGMVGTLTELLASECYKVETTTATARQRLSDIEWNPVTPIGLNAGWNWLGYPVNQTMSVDEAFSTTHVETLDIVVGQNGFAQYDGEKWVGTLETMSPGMGYMYQSQSAKNVIYNTSIVSTAAAKYVPSISKNLPLVLDIHKYGQIMPVVATLNDTDGYSLENEDFQVVAFCGTECRGIGRVVNGFVMMNVYGHINDKITLQVTDSDGEKSYSNSVALNFSETVVGDIFNPYVITINHTTGVTDVKYSGDIKVSVVGDMLTIKGIDPNDIDLLEVYNIHGQRVICEANIPGAGIRISALTTGIYVVIVNGNGEYTYHKITVR